MYYSQQCSYCHKIFYVYDKDKYKAAEKLYHGIKKHLDEYDEDDREFKYDDGLVKDSKEIFDEMVESEEHTLGGYEVK